MEKYLKAFLVFHQIYFPKTHRILDLIELCATIDTTFRKKLKEADKLTDYAVEIRYPDIVEEPSIKEAKVAIKLAKLTKKFIIHKINEK